MLWNFLLSRFFTYVQKKTRTEPSNEQDDFITQVRNLKEPGLEEEIGKFESFLKREKENKPPKKILPKGSFVNFVPEQNEELFKELFLTKK
eukprot:gene10005-2324_t